MSATVIDCHGHYTTAEHRENNGNARRIDPRLTRRKS
jgi:hypothetical protein